MANATVRFYFNDGSNTYTFPYVYSVSDPEPGMKATIIKGCRAGGSVIIPGGKKSNEITLKGKIIDEDGYNDIIAKMDEMRTKVTTDVATLKMQHYDSGWQDDWSFQVRRLEEIRFEESLRTDEQPYQVIFYVINP